MMRADMLPIYVGVATACWLAYRSRGAIRLGAWLPAAAAAAAVGIAAPPLLARLGHDQYNLFELLRTDKPLTGVTLTAICLWIPFTAGCASAMWSSGKRLLAVAWMPAGLLVAWGLLRRAATVESIHDILGGPIFLWPLDLEYIARFAAIYLPFAWLPLVMPPLAMSRRGLLACAVASASLVIVAPLIIGHYSHADNVRELFKPHGGHWFGAMCLLSPWVVFLCGRARWPAGLALAILSSVAAWRLFLLSVEVDTIHGLRLTLPMFAAAFLFYVFCSAPIARKEST